jgi:HPt (histidine-containing phosphotransfer) domain-containing protein
MDDYLAKPFRPEELAAVLTGSSRVGPVATTEEAVDPSVLSALVDRLGPRAAAFRDTLISTWTTETDRRLVELDEAVAAEDPGALARVAHAMKGGSAALGAHRLAALCDELETAAADRGLDLVDARTRLQQEVDVARAGLEALRVS